MYVCVYVCVCRYENMNILCCGLVYLIRGPFYFGELMIVLMMVVMESVKCVRGVGQKDNPTKTMRRKVAALFSSGDLILRALLCVV